MASSEKAEKILALSFRRSHSSVSSWLTLHRAGSGDIEKHSIGSANGKLRLSLCFRLLSSRLALLPPSSGDGSMSLEFMASWTDKMIFW